MCVQIYSFDPAHHFTTPGLFWEAMLNTTNIQLELLTDIFMYIIIQNSLRVGLVQCCHRYTKGINKYLSDYDLNNLYGWAMSQPLPYKDFKWMSTTDMTDFDIHNFPINSKNGYFLEADLIYPYRLLIIFNFVRQIVWPQKRKM